ncbi:hypothetical protein J416_15607 [Gracilibacillus halophilus YIM-C55.5]|uniref:Uncharacterized protein n=1 Tax=Gracilibacillus halophilus YIM-C55.5 TaxID=1308866 RepID=N4WH67_9BACI|nr:hypothetical protein [Gracilibacillus halophilus]ENH95532.1 hypothetical protein J416_15607 [Gracilibacillus halophilus YIM-C55.5]
MPRNIRLSEKLLVIGLSLIFLFMIVQDWVPLGPLNDVQAILQESTVNEIFIKSTVGAGQVLLILIGVLCYVGKRYPIIIKLWLIIHQISIFVGALFDWWFPYFFGYGADQRTQRYQEMFGQTHSFLPEMNGITPNTLHVLFHSILFTCILLTIYISFTRKSTSARQQQIVRSS